MSEGILNLTVHRNTRARQQARYSRKRFYRDFRGLEKMEGIKGWAIVVWDKDWNFRTDWESGGTMPGNVLPEFVKQALLREVGLVDARSLLNPEQPDDVG